GTIGVINCWDIRYPLETLKLAQEGADIIFCPAYWYDEEYQSRRMVQSFPQSRASENQVYFIFCDAYADETSSWSQICSPLFLVAEAGRKEEIIAADINLTDLKESRKTFDCYPRKEKK
ncbi:MAG: carbon-nitrogen hydrolase family protein, partial [Candidatus Aenigmarchaeota archaeon]|nr:carbon-nitrogen hydrolase family protein [Candidatus Aenigmarchaeota archaeon]